MTLFDRLIPVAFLACVALTACGERANGDGYATDKPAGKVETVMQPDRMPAPGSEPVPAQALAPAPAPAPAAEGSIKKSSMLAPRTPKIIWV